MSQLPADLCNIPPELIPQSDEDRYVRSAHNERWEHLKPVIIKLYTCNYGKNNKSLKIPQMVSFMKTNYYFHAAENENPHKFREWGVSGRRLTKDMVDEIVGAIGRRPAAGMSTSRVTLKRGPGEEKLDMKRVKRHLSEGSSFTLPNTVQSGWLSSWTLPYVAFVSALPKVSDVPSPYGTQAATPDYLRINDSEIAFQRNKAIGPSPNTQLLLQKARDDRTSLFLQESLKDLILSLSHDDRTKCFDYFHEFYKHAFITAKHWGPQPMMSILDFEPTFTSWPFKQLPPSSLPVNSPLSLDYEPVLERPSNTNLPRTSFTHALQTAISTGAFTELRISDLPLSHKAIVKSLTESPLALLLDACKLAIMAGNSGLLHDLCCQLQREDYGLDQIHTIYPFHLAASFLNGCRSCCKVYGVLATVCSGPISDRQSVNELGLTIFDSLLVSVLRSHTSVEPETVSCDLGAIARFPGEEQDICGRWDANSPEIRELFAKGYARILTGWKHRFCDSSVEVVCHSVVQTFRFRAPTHINSLSGLFLRRCKKCDLELRLGPLHALVVTALFLAHSGMAGEDLFGPHAILVCLINLGVNVNMRADVSVGEILMPSEIGHCRHRSLTAAEMMRSVPDSIIQGWSGACQAGWDYLLQTLVKSDTHLSEREWSGCLKGIFKSLYEHILFFDMPSEWPCGEPDNAYARLWAEELQK